MDRAVSGGVVEWFSRRNDRGIHCRRSRQVANMMARMDEGNARLRLWRQATESTLRPVVCLDLMLSR